jgi:hypothetical protein
MCNQEKVGPWKKLGRKKYVKKEKRDKNIF